MSDLGGLIIRAGEDISQYPLRAAQAAETYSRMPLNAAQAAEAYSHIPFTQANTIGKQIENEWNQLILGKARPGLTGQEEDTSSYQLPFDPNAGRAAPAAAPVPGGGGGGGGGIGPGQPGGPGETTGGLMAYAQPRPQPGSSASLLAAATPQPSTQVAQVAPPLAPQTRTGMPPQPTGSGALVASSAPLGFGGGTADGGIFMGQTATQPVVQPAGQMPQVVVRPPGSAQMPPAAPQGGGDQTHGSPAGIFSPELGGVMVPKRMMLPYWMSLRPGSGMNPATVLDEIRARRNNAVLQLATGPNDAQSWARATELAYRQGFLSESEYLLYHSRPELQPEVIRQNQPPATTAQQDTDAAGRGLAWSKQDHRYVFDPVAAAGAKREEQGGYIDPRTGLWVPSMTNPAERAGQSGQPTLPPGLSPGAPGAGRPAAPAPAAPAPGGGPQSSVAPAAGPGAAAVSAVSAIAPALSPYAAAVQSHEGYTPPMGSFGWTPGTKVAIARKYAPDAVRGMTSEQIAAMTLPPDVEARMFQGLTADNAVALQQGGIRPSAANLGMAHYIGANGVKNLTKVSPDTTMAQMEQQGLLAPGSVAHNPELQGNTTARGFIQWAQGKYGNTTISPDDIQGAVKAAGPAAGGGGPVVTPPAPAAAPGGVGITGKPELPTGGEQSLQLQGTIAHEEYTAATAAQEAGRTAGMQTPTILDLKHRLPEIAAGSNFEWRRNLGNFVGAWFPQRAQDFMQWATGHDFSKPADQFAAAKEFLVLATQQEAQMPGVRSGLGLTELMANASPNPNMPEKAIHDLLNAMLVRNQAIKDYGDGLYGQVMPRQDAFISDNIRNPYHPVLPGWQSDWNKADGVHAPQVYQAAVDYINGTPQAELERRYSHMTDAQQAEVAAIVHRADPQWRPGTEK